MTNIIRFPALVDIHVHLRDPGQTHKEDFYTGTLSALAGGITTVCDMPNNATPIFTKDTLREKNSVASTKSVCDYGFYFGTDGKNIDEFESIKDEVIGLKVYLNLTTGKILIEEESLVDKIFQAWPKEKIIIVHAEGDKVDVSISLSKKYGNRLHITHVPDKETLEKIIAAKKEKLPVSCDVTPHHLFLTTDNLEKLGSFGAVKPSIKSVEDRDFLWKNINFVDCIATDHAPHSIEEKQSASPPSGFPGLETVLPLLLTAARQGRLTHNDIVRLLHNGPQKIFKLKNDAATYTEVDLDSEWVVKGENLKTKCRWTPFEGWKMKGKINKVVLRGTTVFENDKILIDPGFGKNVC